MEPAQKTERYLQKERIEKETHENEQSNHTNTVGKKMHWCFHTFVICEGSLDIFAGNTIKMNKIICHLCSSLLEVYALKALNKKVKTDLIKKKKRLTFSQNNEGMQRISCDALQCLKIPLKSRGDSAK